jgi:hypothetical protein
VTTIEIVYGISGAFVALAGIAMMVTYTLTNPWWNNHTGRMLMTYAVAETGMAAIFALAIMGHLNPIGFRWVWVTLQATVGVVLCYQTAMILRIHRRARRTARIPSKEK